MFNKRVKTLLNICFMAETASKFIGIRIPLDLVEKMEVVLAHESLQITEYVRGLVRDDLRKRGLLTLETEPAEVGA